MTTFHTNTVELDGEMLDAVAPDGERASDKPHVPCVACESVEVFVLGDALVCTECGQRLALGLEDVERKR